MISQMRRRISTLEEENAGLARCNAILAEENREMTETIQRFCGITDELYGLLAQMMTAAEIDGLSPLFTSIRNMAEKTKEVADVG